MDGGPVFSPDGKNIVYSRYNDPEVNKWRLLEADADGGNEKVLHVGDDQGGPAAELSWSPDGKRLAISTLTLNSKSLSQIQFFDFARGSIEPFVAPNDKIILGNAWAPDGRGIFVSYVPRGERLSIKTQIGLFSYPDGKFHPITNDLTATTLITFSRWPHARHRADRDFDRDRSGAAETGLDPLRPCPGLQPTKAFRASRGRTMGNC